MPAKRGWLRAVAWLWAMGTTGCVDRVIHDYDGVADGEGGNLDTDTETDGLGETEQGSTTSDPQAECMIPQDCAAGQTCFEGVCVGMGTVRISLSWNVVTDLDLHVALPNGQEISYANSVTPYGQLDVDDCVGGMCANQGGTHVENIFLDGSAPRGTYGIQVVNFDGRRSADYTIEVAGEITAQFFGNLPSSMFSEGPVHEVLWP
ncbi:hypothetical protein OEB96_01475 [Paraliomyxa miuraensis]|nr:hypothetical protein [Paraliomyxa miuraensis]